MARMQWVVGFMVAVTGMWSGRAAAENRPIAELPKDVERCTVALAEVPHQMNEVDLDHGHLAAMTWGPAMGAASLVESAAKVVWHAAQPDRRPGHSNPREKGPSGAIMRYEF